MKSQFKKQESEFARLEQDTPVLSSFFFDAHLRWLQLLVWLIVWGLMKRQPLWVILCHLPEKGRKEIEEIAEEMKKEGQERKRNRNGSEETEEIKTFPATKDNRPCPTVSQYQLDALVT